MKNFELFRRSSAFLTAAAISFSLTGCSIRNDVEDGNEEVAEATESIKESRLCRHLDIRFGNVVETFSECGGYEIRTDIARYSGVCYYTILKDGLVCINGFSSDINSYYVNHDVYESTNAAIQKVK